MKTYQLLIQSDWQSVSLRLVLIKHFKSKLQIGAVSFTLIISIFIEVFPQIFSHVKVRKQQLPHWNSLMKSDWFRLILCSSSSWRQMPLSNTTSSPPPRSGVGIQNSPTSDSGAWIKTTGLQDRISLCTLLQHSLNSQLVLIIYICIHA